MDGSSAAKPRDGNERTARLERPVRLVPAGVFSFPAAIRRSLTGHAKTSQLLLIYERLVVFGAEPKKRLNFDPPAKGQQNCPIDAGGTLQI
jgi:hypothetical protein